MEEFGGEKGNLWWKWDLGAGNGVKRGIRGGNGENGDLGLEMGNLGLERTNLGLEIPKIGAGNGAGPVDPGGGGVEGQGWVLGGEILGFGWENWDLGGKKIAIWDSRQPSRTQAQKNKIQGGPICPWGEGREKMGGPRDLGASRPHKSTKIPQIKGDHPKIRGTP